MGLTTPPTGLWQAFVNRLRPTLRPMAPPRSPAQTLAAALSYDPANGALPRVVAHGKGTLAEKLLALARENGVAIQEDADLAEMLTAVDLDSEIPVEAMMAVAEVLAYVYRINGRMDEIRAKQRQAQAQGSL